MKLISFFLKSRTGANVVMLFILGLGLLAAVQIRRETFPSSDLDMIKVSARYEGATPVEVEEAVLRPIEEQCIGIEGLKSISGNASEGLASATIELKEGTDIDSALIDLRDRIEKIKNFPDGVEDIIVSEVKRKDPVATLIVYGRAPERTLKHYAELLRDELIINRIATEAALEAVRAPEILISVTEDRLRQYGITIGQLADAVKAASLDLPLGIIHSERGDFLLRIREQKRDPKDFLTIPISQGPEGAEVTLGTMAEITRGWEDVEIGSRYNGQRAVIVQVNKTETQDTVITADAVRSYLDGFRKGLPSGIGVDIFVDQSIRIEDRLNILVKNGIMGLVLVFLVLWFFTGIKTAFWVAWGIPVSFLGTIFVMYISGMTLNMITMFGLILVLGMIVDDAVVVSENIYTRFRKGEGKYEAAYAGSTSVFWPILASSLTTIGAFVPLMFVTGAMGRTMGALPWVVVVALAVSLIESFFSLPKHIEHGLGSDHAAQKRPFALRAKIDSGVEIFVEKVVGPASEFFIRARYWIIGASIAVVLLSFGMLAGGRLLFTFFPMPDTNSIVARVRYPLGTRSDRSLEMVAELENALEKTEGKLGDPSGKEPLIERVLVRLGETSIDSDRGGHIAQVQVELRDAELRSITSDEVLSAWRKNTTILPGVTSLSFSRLERGVGGKEIDIRLVGNTWENLEAASGFLMNNIATVPGVSNIDTDLRPGKNEISLSVSEEGQRLGLSSASLAQQVRNAFFGAIIQSFQEGSDDVKVRARFSESQRYRLEDLKNLTVVIQSTEGRPMRVPLLNVARIDQIRGWAELKHLDRRRAVAITADIDENVTTAGNVIESLRPIMLDQLPSKFPGVSIRLEGQRATQRETFESLKFGAFIALLIIFCILALVLDSWASPLLVLSIIPMGLVGMIWGHILMDYKLIMLSVMAGVALSGVVINDAIILMDFYKASLVETGETSTSLVLAVKRRFRPIVMTTVTTVAGLLPMLLETSIQAQFLIPMAITIAFGLATGTIGTLVFFPALIQVVDDFKSFFTGGSSNKANEE
jgi:HAE1 family hydrophobic/amphiphilic exporter-1